MAQLEVRTPNSRGELTIEESPLGKGGEGSVHSVLSHSVSGLPPADELVVKIYHKPREGNRREKVISMVSSPPDSEMFAWPLAAVAQDGVFVGYVMDKLQKSQMREWSQLAHTRTRRSIAPDFDVRYAIAACLNYAVALDSLHRVGHIQGDVNESNGFVGADASVVIVDTDSAQIKARDGKIYRCEVGKPEYTAPELIGNSLREQDRTEATDAFGFGILLFQMLTGGSHPTDGRYSGSDDPPSTVSRISQGIYPMLRDESARGFSPVQAIAASAIPLKLRRLMLTLVDGEPGSRIPFSRSIGALQDVQDNLRQCPIDSAHWFDGREGSCGWCAHADSGQPDPWGKPRASAQSKLPPVSFGAASAPTGKAPRAPINAPVHRSGYAPTAVQQSYQQAPSQQGFSGPSSFPPNPLTPAPQISPTLSSAAQQLLLQANGGAPANQQSGFIAPSAPAPAPEPEEIPAKIKGKMTVLYQDGSYGPRPPLGTLFSQNRKLWRQAIATEWPDFLKLWWPHNRPVAKPLGIFLALVPAVVVVVAVVWFANSLMDVPDNRTVLQIAIPLLNLGAVSTVAAFVVWWIASWLGRSRAKKDYGDLDNVRQEHFLITVLRGFGIALSYVLTPVILGGAILTVLVKTVIRGQRESRYRY